MTTAALTLTATTAAGATTNWVSLPVTLTASGSATANYTTTSTYGAPIQLPAFSVNVAIPVNVSTFSPNSQITSGGSIVPGGAVQLLERTALRDLLGPGDQLEQHDHHSIS